MGITLWRPIITVISPIVTLGPVTVVSVVVSVVIPICSSLLSCGVAIFAIVARNRVSDYATYDDAVDHISRAAVAHFGTKSAASYSAQASPKRGVVPAISSHRWLLELSLIHI